MKRIFYSIGLLLLVMTACKKSEIILYNDIARIQFADTSTVTATFVYDSVNVIRDTIFIKVNAIGGTADYDRKVNLEQIPEFIDSLVYDPITHLVVDTLIKPASNQAIPGVHYVDFNDPALQEIMVIKAHEVSAMLPIVLLRDTSLKNNSYRLRFVLRANDEFGVGESQYQACTIQFSDHLERFYSWRVDALQAPAFGTFGNYSVGKHQFMIDVLHTQIDEEWYQAIALAQAQQHYKNLLKEALEAFNNDPANLASGVAPLRENSNPNSPVVTFP